jgi:hypothetical protein
MLAIRWIKYSAASAAILGGFFLTAGPALAQREPVLVVPGRPGVPVMHLGRDISWTVVEGDWGLASSSHVPPTVIYRLAPGALIGPPPEAYFPATGRKPRVGRLEIEPPAHRPLPLPAATFQRTWSSHSGEEPATIYAPYDPPPVIIGPQLDGRKPGRHRPTAETAD